MQTKSVIKDNGNIIAKFNYDIDLPDGAPLIIKNEYCNIVGLPIGLAGSYYVESCIFTLGSEGMVAEYNVEPLKDEE